MLPAECAQCLLDAGFPPAEHVAPLRYDLVEAAIRKLEPAPTPTTHHFGPGTYLRQMIAFAGTIVLGREHRGPCMNIVLSGRCVLIDSDGSTRELIAPQMFVSPPGKKLAYVMEDMAWVNIWATDETDIAKLERELFVDAFADDMAELGLTVEQVRELSEYEGDLNLDPHLTPYVYPGASSIEGRGVFSGGELAGDQIGPARIGGKRTIIGRYVNHSRTPNVEYRRPGEDLYAYALCDIAAGEEITVDYRQARAVA